MNATLLLRVVAAVAAVQGLAHGALFIRARPRYGAAEESVIASMKTNRFFRGGLSYWDYYFGYGLIAAAICIVEAALFWQLSSGVASHAALVRPIVALFAVWNVVHAALLVRYFRFPLPIAFDLIIAALLAWICSAAR